MTLCLSHSGLLTNASIIKSIKWCLKINDEFCSSQSTSSPFLYQTFADLCLSVLLSFYSSNQSDLLYNSTAIFRLEMSSLPYYLSSTIPFRSYSPRRIALILSKLSLVMIVLGNSFSASILLCLGYPHPKLNFFSKIPMSSIGTLYTLCIQMNCRPIRSIEQL